MQVVSRAEGGWKFAEVCTKKACPLGLDKPPGFETLETQSVVEKQPELGDNTVAATMARPVLEQTGGPKLRRSRG
jgi:hypothetical protein